MMNNPMRAVQFMPFNGLRGYDHMISASEQPKATRREITEDRAQKLNDQLSKLHKDETVVITYFSDQGDYVSKICCIKEVDCISRCIRTSKGRIPFRDLWDIETGY